MNRIDWLNVICWSIAITGCLAFWYVVITAAINGLRMAWQ